MSIRTRGMFYLHCGITGAVLIEISDTTMTGLILPEIVYSVKKKLGCIFIEIHNSKPLELTEQGQLPEKRKKNTQSVTGRSNDRDTRTGGAS